MTTSTVLPHRSVQVQTRSTPQTFWRALWVLWICDVLFLCALLFATHEHHKALTVVGRESAPSIIAAQAIKSSLADMDANAVNELLAEPGSAAGAVQTYVTRRQQAAMALIAAAQNITYGEAERRPILAIQLGLGRYEALLQRARDLHEEHNPGFVAAYNQAAHLLDSKILPAADALDQANLEQLERAYLSQKTRSAGSRLLVALAGLALLFVLFSVQVYLFRRTHRVFNPALLAASLLLTVFLAGTLYSLGSADSNLKRAKEDAFESIHALWRAWAVAYSANADESRLLLDPQHANEATNDFLTKRDLLAKLPEGATYESEAQFSRRPPDRAFKGYLADELNNITFPGEREAALETLSAFGRYIEIDARIRELEQQRQHAQAVALCTGTAAGQSDWAFAQFSTALARTLRINQKQFDRSIEAGFAALNNAEIKAAVVITLIAILALLGLMPRIREYR